MKLDKYPELQLEYIENKLKELREDGRQKYMDNKILALHIQLLSETKPESILQELQNWHYPLDEALRICMNKKILDAQAYILEF